MELPRKLKLVVSHSLALQPEDIQPKELKSVWVRDMRFSLFIALFMSQIWKQYRQTLPWSVSVSNMDGFLDNYTPAKQDHLKYLATFVLSFLLSSANPPFHVFVCVSIHIYTYSSMTLLVFLGLEHGESKCLVSTAFFLTHIRISYMY